MENIFTKAAAARRSSYSWITTGVGKIPLWNKAAQVRQRGQPGFMENNSGIKQCEVLK